MMCTDMLYVFTFKYTLYIKYSTTNLAFSQALAKEIAADELDHVIFLRTALGPAAVPMPNLNLGDAFSAAANAALGTQLSPPFSPYAGDIAFLLGAFIFEDVGVTAYKARATQYKSLRSN